MIRFDALFCVFVVLIKFDEKWENRIGFVDYFNSFGILSTNLTRKHTANKFAVLDREMSLSKS